MRLYKRHSLLTYHFYLCKINKNNEVIAMSEIINEHIRPRYEIIEGVKNFMAPSPTSEHGSIVGNLIIIFGNYFWLNDKGRVFGDNIDVHLPDGNLFMPDVSVVCDRSIIRKHGTIYGTPDLIVEVLSRSTMNNDFGIKKQVYERNGVKEYWIIEPYQKWVQVYHLIDGVLILDNVYQIYSPYEFAQLEEDERANVKNQIKVSIFDDLIINVYDIFKWL